MIERILNKLFDKRVIVDCNRSPYLHRWYVIRTKRIGLFIHKFIRSDEERALHDHPWSFIVIPIWRGYIEHTEVPSIGIWERSFYGPTVKSESRVYPIIGTRFRPAEYRHRVELLQRSLSLHDCEVLLERGVEPDLNLPAWSLFIRFRKRREWGFWLTRGFQLWNEWWRDNCE